MPDPAEIMAQAVASADADVAAKAAGASVPPKKATPKKAAATPPAEPPVAEPPTPGDEPTDPPKEAIPMDDLASLKEAYGSLAGSYNLLADQHNALLARLDSGDLQQEIAAKVVELLTPVIEASRGLGASSLSIQSAAKPEFPVAVYQSVHGLSDNSTNDVFLGTPEETKEVLERLVTGLKGSYPNVTKVQMSNEILDKIEDRNFSTKPSFGKVLDEVIDAVFDGSSGSSGGGLKMPKLKFWADKPEKAPQEPKPAKPESESGATGW